MKAKSIMAPDGGINKNLPKNLKTYKGELVDKVTGLNTDHGCVEYYDLATTTWKYHSGQGYRIVATRPTTPPTGTKGFCSDLARPPYYALCYLYKL